MGTEITREEFGERDYSRFKKRLEQCLSDLGQPGSAVHWLRPSAAGLGSRPSR